MFRFHSGEGSELYERDLRLLKKFHFPQHDEQSIADALAAVDRLANVVKKPTATDALKLIIRTSTKFLDRNAARAGELRHVYSSILENLGSSGALPSYPLLDDLKTASLHETADDSPRSAYVRLMQVKGWTTSTNFSEYPGAHADLETMAKATRMSLEASQLIEIAHRIIDMERRVNAGPRRADLYGMFAEIVEQVWLFPDNGSLDIMRRFGDAYKATELFMSPGAALDRIASGGNKRHEDQRDVELIMPLVESLADKVRDRAMPAHEAEEARRELAYLALLPTRDRERNDDIHRTRTTVQRLREVLKLPRHRV